MTDTEILEKAIQKAIDNGWRGGKHLNFGGDWMGQPPKLEVRSPFPSHPILVYTTGGLDIKELTYPPEVMLFDHDFAKALWGKHVELLNKCPKCDFFNAYDAKYCPNDGKKLVETEVMIGRQPWVDHLQNMVISDNPIKYLEANL